MKVKGGGKRKIGNPALNDAMEANGDDFENLENFNYESIDVNEEHQGNQEQEKEKEKEKEKDEDENNHNEDEEEEEEVDEEEEEEEAVPQEERPKLDEGFFEIEAIRRKRVRKGQLQYLIKWRGWPENANTWEPLENLQSCSDVIDAFEESLWSGKSSRKRKRKSGGSNILPKKKQPRSYSAPYNVAGSVGQSHSADPLFNTGLIYHHSSATQSICSGLEGENNGNINNLKIARHANENRLSNCSKQVARSEETEYDPKLSELKGMISNNEANAEKLALNFQEARVSEGNGIRHGLSKVDQLEPVHNDRRTGSRRRKSSSVKRFKQDLDSPKLDITQVSTPSIAVGCDSADEQLGIVNSNHLSKLEDRVKPSAIVKILKPIDFSASVSDDVQDVVVTFMAVRSDGKEVMVDNKYLKANNPLLLINFYEQHLKYSTH